MTQILSSHLRNGCDRNSISNTVLKAMNKLLAPRIFTVFAWIVAMLLLTFLLNDPDASLPAPRSLTENPSLSALSPAAAPSLRHATKATEATKPIWADDDEQNDDEESEDDDDPPSEFEWSELQATQGVKGICGADKCFWRSTTDPDNVGYLVGNAEFNYNRMKLGYYFAKDVIEEKCNAKHLYLEPPIWTKVTPDFIRELNSLTQNEHAAYVDKINPKEGRGRKKRHQRVFGDLNLVVQKVRVAPSPTLSFWAFDKWEMTMEENVPKFREELLEKHKRSLQARGGGVSPATDASILNTVEAKLESELKGIKCALDVRPMYYYDFQGLIDTDGNYFHIDVDAQFWPERRSAKVRYQRRRTIIDKFTEMVQLLVDPPPPGYDNDNDDDGSDDETDDDHVEVVSKRIVRM